MHLHAYCSCKNTAETFDRHVTGVVTVKIIFNKNPISVCLIAVAALASVRAGYVELIAFRVRGQKIS